MMKNFFKVVGLLLSIALAVISLIIGIRAGIMAGSVWNGIGTGGGFAIGVALFIIGITHFNQSGYDNKLAKVLYSVVLSGIALLGLSLSAMVVSDTFQSINPIITEWGLIIGSTLFAVPLILVSIYFGFKALITVIRKCKILSLVTVVMMAIISIAMYFVSGVWSVALGTAFGFLFYWASICFLIHIWKAVQYEENSIYWKIGLALLIGCLSGGLCYVFSEVFVNIHILHNILLWIANNIAQYLLFGFLGYVSLIVVAKMFRSIYLN